VPNKSFLDSYRIVGKDSRGIVGYFRIRDGVASPSLHIEPSRATIFGSFTSAHNRLEEARLCITTSNNSFLFHIEIECVVDGKSEWCLYSIDHIIDEMIEI